ncbi:MAG: DUF3105 domain-containing protein [Egibacteraceae bacterium]
MGTEPLSKRDRQRQRREERLLLEAQRRKAQRRNRLLIWIGGSGVLIAVVALAIVPAARRAGPTPPPQGIADVPVAGRDHVRTSVDYPTVPPAGGPHAPVWQNCGFYDNAVPNETAVHSLEHGAVWLAYDPSLSQAGRHALQQLVTGRGFVLASPVTGLNAPVVATAWGKLLRTDGPEDPRLAEFVRAFVNGPQTPEPGAPCSGGVGQPSA